MLDQFIRISSGRLALKPAENGSRAEGECPKTQEEVEHQPDEEGVRDDREAVLALRKPLVHFPHLVVVLAARAGTSAVTRVAA